MHIALDYAGLRVIWWALMGVLLIGFALTDGWDLGIGTLLPFVARTDTERRMAINCAGPTWEGNQVWFVLGGGAIFAAWPLVYAVSFSGFYLAMFLVLAALILRPVGFKYRSKRPDPVWRSAWDWALFVGGVVPSLVFGVAVGNVLQGLPFHFDSDLRVLYDGSFLGLFTPFTLLCGVLSVSMMALHGSAYLTVKLEHGPVHDRARTIGTGAAALCMLLFVIGGMVALWGPLGYDITGPVVTDGASNPLRLTAIPSSGAWTRNFIMHPWMYAAPVLGVGGAASALVGMWLRQEIMTLAGSSAATVGIVSTVGLSMFPFILPSSTDIHSSLTVWNASSSRSTLLTMLVATLVFLPIILLYTSWVYRVLWGRVTVASMASNPDLY
ncbi:cytochrome d ubiquinol oxidase subunit II [Lichenicoccus roseus]|uniref:Cytochrome d ubiquinol oxidase subunit II n=1 Tax=Lichenicoccus roseus TaxID=2683649 RepID=A0A5R9JAK9_9PROT|nr:cytochrome d ubiquinol oxidase subunit II [Lichenicoccus roseus]TLU71248.1 cytochrome d ubiquinol oxidase subunit II [Lichenicoccus roseus]